MDWMPSRPWRGSTVWPTPDSWTSWCRSPPSTIDATEGDATNLPATDPQTDALAQNSLDEIADLPNVEQLNRTSLAQLDIILDVYDAPCPADRSTRRGPGLGRLLPYAAGFPQCMA